MKVFLMMVVILLSGCGTANLKQSLQEVTGKNIQVIRTYPTEKITAINGNTVYVFAERNPAHGGVIGHIGSYKGESVCEIFFEVDKKNIIILTSWKGPACNSFYNRSLSPQ